VGEKHRFARRAMLWRARQQDRGCAVREVGREARSLENKWKKESGQAQQGNFESEGKEEAVEKRKRPSSEQGNEAQKQQHGEGVGGSRATGESVWSKCNNACVEQVQQCSGSSICDHKRTDTSA